LKLPWSLAKQSWQNQTASTLCLMVLAHEIPATILQYEGACMRATTVHLLNIIIINFLHNTVYLTVQGCKDCGFSQCKTGTKAVEALPIYWIRVATAMTFLIKCPFVSEFEGVTLACCRLDICAHSSWDVDVHLAKSWCCSGCIHMWLLKQGACHAMHCDIMHSALINGYKEYSPQL